MCFCGYHPAMWEGLKRFGEGLVAALLDKAQKNGCGLERQLSREQDEMQLLVQRLELVMDRSQTDREYKLARGFLGLAYISLFALDEFNDPDKMREDLRVFVEKHIAELVGVLRAFDGEFEKHPSRSLVMRGELAWRKVMDNFFR